MVLVGIFSHEIFMLVISTVVQDNLKQSFFFDTPAQVP
jgi:hypothetical protein